MIEDRSFVPSPHRTAGILWTLAALVVLVSLVLLSGMAIATMDSGGERKDVAMMIGVAGCAGSFALSLAARIVWRRSAAARIITPIIALTVTLLLAITALILMWTSKY